MKDFPDLNKKELSKKNKSIPHFANQPKHERIISQEATPDNVEQSPLAKKEPKFTHQQKPLNKSLKESKTSYQAAFDQEENKSHLWKINGEQEDKKVDNFKRTQRSSSYQPALEPNQLTDEPLKEEQQYQKHSDRNLRIIAKRLTKTLDEFLLFD